MFEVRAVSVMGYLQVSVWCRSHGKGADHCLWSGAENAGYLASQEVLSLASAGLARAAQAAWRGELELTDDCLT